MGISRKILMFLKQCDLQCFQKKTNANSCFEKRSCQVLAHCRRWTNLPDGVRRDNCMNNTMNVAEVLVAEGLNPRLPLYISSGLSLAELDVHAAFALEQGEAASTTLREKNVALVLKLVFQRCFMSW